MGSVGVTNDNLSYDSNTDGKWNNGHPRTVRVIDTDCPRPFTGGKGLVMHASGNPQLEIDGEGTAILVCQPGHGRFYTDVCNYNSVIEYEINFMDTNVENSTCQSRSRHQEGGPPQNRFGGLGAKISPVEVGLKIEKFHNEHESGVKKSLAIKLEIGKWYKVRYTVTDNADSTAINQKLELDYADGEGYKTVLENKKINPPAYYVDRKSFEKKSYYWLRMNNSKTGKVGFRNIKLTAL